MTGYGLQEYTDTLLEDIRADFAEKKVPVIKGLPGYGTASTIAAMADDTHAVTSRIARAAASPDERSLMLFGNFGMVPPDVQEGILQMITKRPANLDAVVLLTGGDIALAPRTQGILDGSPEFRIHDYTG